MIIKFWMRKSCLDGATLVGCINKSNLCNLKRDKSKYLKESVKNDKCIILRITYVITI